MGLGQLHSSERCLWSHVFFLGKHCSGQEVHKDGIGCGLAEDEGSQGDQKDSITDQCPPAVRQRIREYFSHFFLYFFRLIFITANIISHLTSVGKVLQASERLSYTKVCDPSSLLK